MVKATIKLNALKYLKKKQRSKGSEICYNNVEMADYLLPENDKLTIFEKQQLFAVRNRMTEIASNFPQPGAEPTCLCGAEESMKHIFNCQLFKEENEESEELVRAECVRCPWLLAQTKVATIFGKLIFLLFLLLVPLLKTI